MTEFLRYKLDASNEYAVMVFKTQEQADAWQFNENEIEVTARPSLQHIWQNDEWVLGPEIAITNEQVDVETRRRIISGVPFDGHIYQFDEGSKQRITGAATLAGFAIAAGAQIDDLRWSDPNKDFKFIDVNNERVPMDAQTCFSFGQTAAKWESDHIFAGRDLKDMETIPQDYADDKYWP